MVPPRCLRCLSARSHYSICRAAGFKAMLDRIASNGVRCILVESPDRFARDLTVQLTGHDFLTARRRLLAASSPRALQSLLRLAAGTFNPLKWIVGPSRYMQNSFL